MRMQTDRRRVLLRGLCVLLVVPPLAALAQTPSKAVPRIGFLDPGSSDSGLYGPFLTGLKELGYIEGKNISVQARFANGDLERLPALAKELADTKPDVL